MIATIVDLALALAIHGFALVLLFGFLTAQRQGYAQPQEPAMGRRTFFVGASGVAITAGLAAMVEVLNRRSTFGYDGRVTGPSEVKQTTPNGQFYIVTKNLIDPYVVAGWWRLHIGGSAAHPHTYSLQDLMSLPAVTQETTLECISNGVGYGLLSNAAWKGVPLHSLLEQAGLPANAQRLHMQGVDGYVHTTSIEKAMDPKTLVAYEMNGAPLPQRHGHPARVLLPSSYGEVSVKWVTLIEPAAAGEKGYYESQGWEPAMVHTMSRIDEPAAGQVLTLSSGPVAVKGVAFAAERGISKVEVSTDGGQSWQAAEPYYAPGPPVWTLWTYAWRPAQPGAYELQVRAADGTGSLQTSKQQGFAPAGATGYHSVKVRVQP